MTVGTGEVTVTAQYQGLALLGAVHLFLTVGSPPESLAALAVTVRDLATSAGVKGANVVVTPDDGSPQTCVTGLLGSCGVYVRHGSMVIAATAPGYQPGQMAFAIGPTSISVTATLSLSPSGS
jgi:hypothetical protein